MPEVSIIIISFNTREMTLQCLASVYTGLANVDADVWVVDNASADDSVAAIRAAYPQVRIITNEKNLGFGAANNQGMTKAAGESFLLLNSDAFPEPGAIRALVDYLKAHPKAGVVGPRLLNRDGSLQQSCFRFPSPGRVWMENLWISAMFSKHEKLGDYRHWQHDQERQVDFVIAACMLVRREVFEKLGGFDERFFMYSEESDWLRRITDAGWQVMFTPAARVTHLGGASGATQKAKINRHFFESLDYYEWKHHGMAGLVALRTAMVIGCFMRTILWLAMIPIPRRRELAISKAKLLSWLLVRQSTFWRLPLRQAAR
jgi:GT2 family glycosyltransferase